MEYVEKLGNLFNSVSSFYNDINPATLSGAIDIVVVEQKNGDLTCSPFHVRFGKLSLLMPQEKKIEIKVNGQVVPYLMKVGDAGESFFVFETEHEVPEEFQTSPIMVAVNEDGQTDQEPPFLDIGVSKNQGKAKDQQEQSHTKDSFDENGTIGQHHNNMKHHLPAELQSPKIVIEEQMDKVVANIDPYSSQTPPSPQQQQQSRTDNNSTPQHDIYPMDDGSSLLRRVIPEAITTTTIAKETFIVRPVNGDINSKVMDVSHRSIQTRKDGTLNDLYDMDSNSNSSEAINTKDTFESSSTHLGRTSYLPELQRGNMDNVEGGMEHHTRKNNESIVLDIAGYKTGDHGWNADEVDELVTNRLIGLAGSTPQGSTSNMADAEGRKEDNTTLDKLENSTKSTSPDSWGWGASPRHSATDSSAATSNGDRPATTDANSSDSIERTEIDRHAKEEDGDICSTLGRRKQQLDPGTTYRIKMSLCSLSSFGSDEKKNAVLFEEHQISYDTFMKNPNLLNDKRLVFLYEDRYFPAGYAGPLFTSLLLFKKPLQSQNTDGSLSVASDGTGHGDLEDSRESYLFGKGWRQWLSRSSMTGPPDMDSSLFSGSTTIGDDVSPSKDTGDDEGMTTRFTTSTKATTLGWNSEQDSNGNEDASNDTPPRKHYAKTLRLTSEQLKQLGLKKGVNSISFSVTSAYQGTAICAAKIFYWDYDMPIVISDIDGTITKSDALGHVFTMIGKDWTHHGVAKLYTDIHNNGYKILYLTSRAIGQADYTRDYLKKVEQGPFQLPDGPVILSPDRLFTSFHREVIMRKPEVFKMACLKDIQRLFGGLDPFYAGFGNRITDAISYRSVHVPASRIFTIDPNGLIKLELLKGFTSSYLHLNDLVDHIFPPVNTKTIATDEEYNDWNYWRQPLPDIDLPASVTMDTRKSPPLLSTKIKPKPIKPDLSSLPVDAIVESEQQTRGGILRSLTSLSSSSSSSLLLDKGMRSNTRSRQQSLPLSPQRSNTTTSVSSSPPFTSSGTSPIESTSMTSSSTRRSRVQSFTDTLRRPSLLLGSMTRPSPPSSSSKTQSSTEEQEEEEEPKTDEGTIRPDTNHTKDDQALTESPTSPSLMYHLSLGFDEVRHSISKKFSYDQRPELPTPQTSIDAHPPWETTQSASQSLPSPPLESSYKEGKGDQPYPIGKYDQEQAALDNEEDFDPSLDDLEEYIGDIPFI